MHTEKHRELALVTLDGLDHYIVSSRAKAAEDIERLASAFAEFEREVLEKVARWHDEQAERLRRAITRAGTSEDSQRVVNNAWARIEEHGRRAAALRAGAAPEEK